MMMPFNDGILLIDTRSYRSNRGKIGGGGCEQEEQSHGEHPQQQPFWNQPHFGLGFLQILLARTN